MSRLSPISKPKQASLTLFAATWGLCSQALADIDANAFAEIFRSEYPKSRNEITIGSAELRGSGVVFRNVKARPDGLWFWLDVGDVTFDNVREQQGVYSFDKLNIVGRSIKRDELTIELGAINFAKGTVTRTERPTHVDAWSFFKYEQFELAPSRISMNGSELGGVGTTKLVIAPDQSKQAYSFKFSAPDWFVSFAALPPSQGPDQDTINALGALGFLRVSGDYDIAGTWTANTGRLVLDRHDIAVDGAGVLKLALDIDGLTEDFVGRIDAADAEDQKRTRETGEDNMEATNELMGELTLHSASLAFSDAGLTGKLLDYFAFQSGETRADAVIMGKFMAPIVAGELGDPQFTVQASQAAAQFLDAPSVITIKAKPLRPLTFGAAVEMIGQSGTEFSRAIGLSIQGK